VLTGFGVSSRINGTGVLVKFDCEVWTQAPGKIRCLFTARVLTHLEFAPSKSNPPGSMFTHTATLKTMAPLLCRLLRVSMSSVSETQLYCMFQQERAPIFTVILMKDKMMVRLGVSLAYVVYPGGVTFGGEIWKKPARTQEYAVCLSHEVDKVFLALHDKMAALLCLNPSLKMRERVPPSVSVLPAIFSFQQLLVCLAFLCRGHVVGCREGTGTLSLYKCVTQVIVNIVEPTTGKCVFLFCWPGKKLELQLIPDVDVRFDGRDSLEVDSSKVAMDCVLVYLLVHIRHVLRMHMAT
jgi:hypothetical protein